MESEVGGDVGVSYHGKEGRDVEHTHVRGVHVLTIWEAGNNGLVGWAHVGHGGTSSCEKVICCTRVKNDLCSHGSHVVIDSFE